MTRLLPLTLLLFALSAFGQPAPINRRAMVISGLATVSSPFPGNVSYYWVFSDMPTNINVTNWVDRIQGSVWTNGSTSATRPTNSSLGVHFTRASSQRLTNSTFSYWLNNSASQWMIVRTDLSGNFFQDILDYAESGAAVWGFDNAQRPHTVINSHETVTPFTCGTGVFMDLAVVTDGAKTFLYTNGVPAKTNALFSLDATHPWTLMGGTTFSGYFLGYIKELAVWTNTVFTGTQISNLHYYATNTYLFTP